jgi:hypothetical protein
MTAIDHPAASPRIRPSVRSGARPVRRHLDRVLASRRYARRRSRVVARAITVMAWFDGLLQRLCDASLSSGCRTDP